MPKHLFNNRSAVNLFLLCSFRTLCTVLRTALRAVSNSCSVESTAYDMVTNAREILYTSAAYEYNRVLLKVVALTGDVGVHFLLVG